jgi:hypothetical protein
MIPTGYLLRIEETILYSKEKCNCAVNKQVSTYNTRNSVCHRYVHTLELYNSKPSVAGCIFYNKLPNNIKQVGDNYFKKKLKDLLIPGCCYSAEDYHKKNSVVLATDK